MYTGGGNDVSKRPRNSALRRFGTGRSGSAGAVSFGAVRCEKSHSAFVRLASGFILGGERFFPGCSKKMPCFGRRFGTGSVSFKMPGSEKRFKLSRSMGSAVEYALGVRALDTGKPVSSGAAPFFSAVPLPSWSAAIPPAQQASQSEG